jgi:hypothetical protein
LGGIYNSLTSDNVLKDNSYKSNNTDNNLNNSYHTEPNPSNAGPSEKKTPSKSQENLPATAAPWVRSKLTRFGVELIHPSSFKRLKGAWEEPNFEGSLAAHNTDTISDGVMSVRVEYEADDFENSWARELRKNGSNITYKTKKSDWYVVSGVRADGIEFYRKVWLIDSWCFSFDAQYPHKLNYKYDLVLERMLKGFKPKITQW